MTDRARRLHSGDDRYSLEYVVRDWPNDGAAESDVMPIAPPPLCREVPTSRDVAPELFDFTELADIPPVEDLL